MNRLVKQSLYFGLFRSCGFVVVGVIVILIGYIVLLGVGKLSLDFLIQFPRVGMSQGGIMPQIVGTIYLMLLVLVIAIPVGVLTAIYLVEYQKNTLMQKIWRVIIHNLAGVPSIVYGLLGLGLFIFALNLQAPGGNGSLIAAGLTLSILVLPIIISAARESILAIPSSLREASIALGATKWQTVRHHVLPYAMPGILTGVILSLSRAAGETAPIILVGAAYYLPDLPGSLLSQFQALPYHIYALATQTRVAITGPSLYGAALVLLMLVVGMNIVAVVLRNKYRKRYRW